MKFIKFFCVSNKDSYMFKKLLILVLIILQSNAEM